MKKLQSCQVLKIYELTGLVLSLACCYHYHRDTARYTSFRPEVNTGALLLGKLVATDNPH